jgi:hypothetical protein
MKSVFVLFLFISVFAISQERIQKKYIQTNFSYQLLDFFLTEQIGFQNNNFSSEFGVGFGVNRSVFQRRFFPKLDVKINQSLLNSIFPVKLNVFLSYSFSALKVNKQSNNVHYFNELLTGFSIGYGKKLVLLISPELGLLNELFFNRKLNQHYSFTGVNYRFSIGLKKYL